MRSLPILFIVTMVLAAPASANDTPAKTSVALGAGTLGMGVALSRALPVANLTARIGYNGFSYGMNDTIEGIAYDLQLDLSSAMALLDWQPWGRITRFSAGLIFNGNEINALSQSAASYTVGGTTYPAAGVGNLTGTASFDSVVPYAGLGWNFSVTQKTALTFELGVVFQGAPQLSLQADGPLAQDAAFQTELETETAQFRQDIESYQYYPVIALGLSRSF